MSYRATLVTSILALLLTATTSPATAATYNVQSCKEFVREHLPSTDWRFEPRGNTFEIRTDCVTGPTALRTLGGAVTPYGSGAGITFGVPAPLSIVGYKGRHFLRTPQSADSSRPWRWRYETAATSLNGETFLTSYCDASCTGYFANPGWTLPRPIRSMNWQLACEVSTRTDCPSGAEISIFDAEFTVDDPTIPQLLEPPSGAVFSGGVELAGEQTVSFKAADTGTGIYRAVVEIDGTVTGISTPNHTEYPTCVVPFRVAQPCPATYGNGITFPTHNLVDGSHEAVLRVYDATDVNAVTYGPVRFTTANRRAANFCGPDSIDLVSTNVPKEPLRFASHWTYRSQVANSAGFEAVLLEGRNRISVLGAVTVPADGRVSFRLPASANRMLRLAVRPRGSTGKFACSKPSLVRVAAKVRFAASPDEVSNGRAIRLSGRLLGRSNRGRSVVIQARAVGSRRWATVRALRTKRYGRFSMKYRFLSTFSTVTYVFRARAQSGRGYPYAAGSSRQRRVRVYGSGS